MSYIKNYRLTFFSQLYYIKRLNETAQFTCFDKVSLNHTIIGSSKSPKAPKEQVGKNN